MWKNLSKRENWWYSDIINYNNKNIKEIVIESWLKHALCLYVMILILAYNNSWKIYIYLMLKNV